jgi:hypothetical protein
MSLKSDLFPIRPLTAGRFRSWLARSEPGAALEYHRGMLILDRSPASELSEDKRRTVAKIADAVSSAAEDRLVHLVQCRNGPFDFSYVAIKAAPARGKRVPRPLAPASTICRLLPREHGDGQQLRAPRHRSPVGIVSEPLGCRAGALGDGAAAGPTLTDQRCRCMHCRGRGRVRSGDGPDPGRAS